MPQGAVAVGAIFQQLDMRGIAAFVFHDTISPDPPPQLRHGVGSHGRSPDKGRIEGPALFPAELNELRHVYVHRQADVGIRRVTKMLKVGLAWIVRHVDFAEGHIVHLYSYSYIIVFVLQIAICKTPQLFIIHYSLFILSASGAMAHTVRRYTQHT